MRFFVINKQNKDSIIEDNGTPTGRRETFEQIMTSLERVFFKKFPTSCLLNLRKYVTKSV